MIDITRCSIFVQPVVRTASPVRSTERENAILANAIPDITSMSDRPQPAYVSLCCRLKHFVLTLFIRFGTRQIY